MTFDFVRARKFYTTFTNYLGIIEVQESVTVAVRSEAWVLAGWLLGLWVRIPLKAWMFVRVFLCCVVLCR
jgi:hypothetical protein